MQNRRSYWALASALAGILGCGATPPAAAIAAVTVTEAPRAVDAPPDTSAPDQQDERAFALIGDAMDPEALDVLTPTRSQLVTEIQGLEGQFAALPAGDPSRPKQAWALAVRYSVLARRARDDMSSAEDAAIREKAQKIASAAGVAALKYYHLCDRLLPDACLGSLGRGCRDERLYRQGFEYELLGNLEQARRAYFQLVQLSEKGTGSPLAPSAYLRFGVLFFSEGKLDLADQSALEALKYPEFPHTDGALFLRLRIAQRRGQTAEVASLQEELRAQHKNSPLVAFVGGSAAREPSNAPPAEPVRGRIAPEEIQRAIRAQFGEIRTCYEEGLQRNPSLVGKVTLRFVIGRDGRIAAIEAESAGTVRKSSADAAAGPAAGELTDEKVVACVVDKVRGVVFPLPKGGIVTVVYPIIFSPGEP